MLATFLAVLLFLAQEGGSFSLSMSARDGAFSRKAAVERVLGGAGAAAMCLLPAAAYARPDCYANCSRIAPKGGAYCKETCEEYCAQPDRQDGLSGSIGNAKGEVGFLSALDGGTVVYGKDLPPETPDIIPASKAAFYGRKINTVED